ncbi:S1C family serine protease [Flagellimonas flava]|uniref:Serine protease Do n=1 Tax=Flagellimonas flava TaxID=570519 RepID=A0A1M5NKR9_9FLAO|nr:trypsin-like peptidase domain-containing protein [Allomuricauda flava]SHG90057.1 serine protease Do [Allomuricauda flava]
MKTIFNLIFALIVSFHQVAGQSEMTPSETYQKVNDAVVEIIANSKDRSNPSFTLYEEGQGSGVVISKDGLVLTAAHVVQTAEKIEIRFTSGKKVPAKVIRLSKGADIALLKLAWIPDQMNVVTLGDSDKTQIGDKVCIIGAPYGLSHSLSVGHISRRHQELNKTTGFLRAEFFQTDAAINHGNSGGPMFNNKGEVIGIVSSILSESGGFEGIGFAATSNVTKNLVVDENSLYTGLDGYILDEGLAYLLNVPQKSGLLIQRVVPLSPADFAGLKGGILTTEFNEEEITLGGDIVLSVNNIKLDSLDVLEEIVQTIKDKKHENGYLKLEVLRGGKIEKLSVQLKN